MGAHVVHAFGQVGAGRGGSPWEIAVYVADQPGITQRASPIMMPAQPVSVKRLARRPESDVPVGDDGNTARRLDHAPDRGPVGLARVALAARAP